ncbi:right-handed parallel beta-helix repeat-containing protein [Echinicola sp. CAU 1574]|uniref:Right-handed parallel beta-helix repeat-containing protein n=1 Tax=Echinicola arenosa TaxID=2774144 RepID=A0ABR9AMM4_9BACT|nr:right-handed parallel beta-helix repeat-containing protein [Echinicola arenosa]MBD8490043.1 right-handed parallel beta-helix repeat-containing protein [Echinicola arenosa]
MNSSRLTYWILFCVFCLLGTSPLLAVQSSNTTAKTWNVKSENAKGDGLTDDTKAIQATISKAQPGDTVWIPEGTYLVKALGLKSGVNIKSAGLLKQVLDKNQEYNKNQQSSTAPLFRGNEVSNIYLSVRTQTQNESIYLSKSENIIIDQSSLKGDSTKLRSFAGILLYRCIGAKILKTTISHYGMPRKFTDSYQPGTGIRVLESRFVQIHEANIHHNGENGVFIHSSHHVDVTDSHIYKNGMSGIQVAFGGRANERDFHFVNNILEENAGDAIDINNRSTRKILNIHSLIYNNKSKANGFVRGEPTPDGSGIATLVNVSGVTIQYNTAEGNNRPAIYLEKCGIINIDHNKADNEVEVVGQLLDLHMKANQLREITFINNVSARKILLENNTMNTMHMPNGLHIDSLKVRKNEFNKATLNINLIGKVLLEENTIKSSSTTPCILLVKADGVLLKSNTINSSHSTGIVVRNMAKNVAILNNEILASNACITDDGSEGLKVENNILKVLESGQTFQTIKTTNPKGLQLSNNQHFGKNGQVALLMEGTGTANMVAEKIINGSTHFGEVKVTQSID